MPKPVANRKTSPKISVAMSVYNGEQYLALAIESILAQSFDDFEFLILDDGSSDGSAKLIDDFAANDNRIRVIRRENKGLVVSLNELIGVARAPLIARMDCDDIAKPERFAKQIAFLDANPDYGVVGTWIDNIDAQGQIVDIAGADHPTDHTQFMDRIGQDTVLCHSSVMMRKEPLLAVGGYHQAFKHCEDFDLWLRLASVTKLCSLPERLMKYRHWADQISNRHAYVQRIGAGVSLAAFGERQAGRSDPTETLEALPPLNEMDRLFGREGMDKQIRKFVVPNLLYSEEALRTQGFGLVKEFIAEGSDTPGLWRTVLRLVRIGAPIRAADLAIALSRRALTA